MSIAYPVGVHGVTLRVLEAGDPTGVPAVLLHGVGARADRFSANLDALAAAGLHVFALDCPGHGFSTKGPGPDYSIPGFGKLVLGFLASQGIEQAVLIATSLGGGVASWLTVQAPERVRALVLVGSLGLVALGQATRDLIAATFDETDEPAVRAKLARVIHDPATVTDAWVREETRINSSPGADRAFAELAGYFRERIDDDVVGPRLAALQDRLPMLLIWGARDGIVSPAVGQRAQLELGLKAELELIPDTAHAPYLEAPDIFNVTVIDFLGTAGIL